MPTFGADTRQAYQQVWPEVSRPYAGVTFPEWAYDLKPIVVTAVFVPGKEMIALQAVNRGSVY